MNTTIYRYRLVIDSYPEVVLPQGAEVLSVGPPRDGQPLLDMWALVDPTAALAPRSFRLVGTGHPLPDDCGRFIGTIPTHEGRFVWHVFESANSHHEES